MAKISGKEKNYILIQKIEKEINKILASSRHTEENENENYKSDVIEGNTTIRILNSDVERYKNLREIKEILNFAEKEEKDLYQFEQVYLPKNSQEKLFELINNPEINIDFPNVFGEYGEIPNTNGVKCPRPKSMLESIEEYEEFLKNYYKKNGIEATYNEDGIRQPYPHEKFEWKKGTATLPLEENYKSSYYNNYVTWKNNKTKKEKENSVPKTTFNFGTPPPTPPKKENTTQIDNSPKQDDNTTSNDREATSAERTKKRKGLNRRVYPKDKKTLKDYLFAPFRKVSEADATLANGKNWPKIKRVLVGAAIAVGGVVALQYVGIPLITQVLKGFFFIPEMITGAITGVMATPSGGMITLSALDRIVFGLVGAAVPASLFALIRKLAKKHKKGGTEIEEGDDEVEVNPTPPPSEPTGTTEDDDTEIDPVQPNPGGPTTDDDDTEKNPLGSEDETGGNPTEDTTQTPTETPDEDETINIPADAPYEEKLAIIKNKLRDLNDQIEQTNNEIKLINESGTHETDLTKKRKLMLEKKLIALKAMRNRYIDFFTETLNNEGIEITEQTKPTFKTATGGM